MPQRIAGDHSGVLEKAEVTALNDQHAFLRLPAAKPTMSQSAPWCDWGSRIRAPRSTNGG